jgi:hypothetical protein
VSDPNFVDIDGDGDLDALIISNGANNIGNFQVQLNTGSASAPAFDEVVLNPYGLVAGYNYANATFVDIDADGDLDVVTGD